MLQQPAKQQVKIGAGGGTRTHTTFYSPGILSPVRLPFRHTGNLMFTAIPYGSDDQHPPVPPVVRLLQPERRQPRVTAKGKFRNTGRRSRGARFTKVLAGRKQPIRGPWGRNIRAHTRLTFEAHHTGQTCRVQLPPWLCADAVRTYRANLAAPFPGYSSS